MKRKLENIADAGDDPAARLCIDCASESE